MADLKKVLLLLWSMLFSSAGLTEPLVLYTEQFPPYNFLQQEEIVGINTELVALSCQHAAIECQFELYPWLRAYDNAIKHPFSGIFSTARTAERQTLFQWVGPLSSSRGFFYRLKSRPDIQVNSLADAKNYIIGVARGDAYELYLLNEGFRYGENLLGFTNKADVVALFLQGKVDLLIGSDRIVPHWLQNHDADMSDLKAVFELKHVGSNYLALNPAVPADIVKRLQAALDKLMADGELLRRLNQKYLQHKANP